MKKDLIHAISEKKDVGGFIKVSDAPLTGLSDSQKVLLNRKGNVLFNEGQIETAKRIFITTGYSDGLTRIGNVYLENKRTLDALKMFVLAHNTKKATPLYEQAAGVISAMLKG
ncbi:MAG: hypothetical protein K6E51_06125 [Treponema sp.]|nr:hypothetical protein [Treponema sp.]